MHSIKEKPVVVNGQIVIRPIMVVALTYDHRLLDGREGVTFLGTSRLCRVLAPNCLQSASRSTLRTPAGCSSLPPYKSYDAYSITSVILYIASLEPLSPSLDRRSR